VLDSPERTALHAIAMQIGEVAKELMDLFEIWRQWDEDDIKAINILVRSKLQS